MGEVEREKNCKAKKFIEGNQFHFSKSSQDIFFLYRKDSNTHSCRDHGSV